MSSINSAVDRELLKANARHLREKEALQNKQKERQRPPIFGPPIKKPSSDVSYINRILGSWDKVQPALQNSGSNLYGCGTPATSHPASGPVFPTNSGSSRSTEKQNGEHRARSHGRERPPPQHNATSRNRPDDLKHSSSSHSTYLNSDKYSGRTGEHNKKGHSHVGRDGDFKSNVKERSRSKSSSRPHGQDHVSKSEHHQRSNSAGSVTNSHQNKDPSAKTQHSHTNRISPVRPSACSVSTTAKADSSLAAASAKADSTTSVSSASHNKSIPSASVPQSTDSETPFKSPVQSPEKPKLPKASPTPSQQPALSSHTKSAIKPPNGIVHNGAIRSEPEHKSKPHRPTVSKLWLPKHESSENEKIKEQLHVRNILEEMNLHPPLTGIHTPKKEDSSRFPFPGLNKIPHLKGLSQSGRERGNGIKEASENVTSAAPGGQASTKTVSKPMGGSQGSSQALAKELEISSDSEDDEQDGNIKKQCPKKPPRKRSHSSVMLAGASSSSGSESSDSESSSGSDSSGSEDGEEEEVDRVVEAKPMAASSPLPTPTQGKKFSWALDNFRQDKSLEGPGNLIATEDTSYQSVNPNNEDLSINTSSLLDKSNAEALDVLSHGLDKLVNSVPCLLSPVDSKSMDLPAPINMDLDIEKEMEFSGSQEIADLLGSVSPKLTEDSVNLDERAKAPESKIPNVKSKGEQSKSNNVSDIPKSSNTKSPSASSVKSSISVKSNSSGTTKSSNKSSSKSKKTSAVKEKTKVSNSKTEEKVKSNSSQSKSDSSTSKKTPTKSEKTGNTTPKGATTPKKSSAPKGPRKGKSSPKGFTSKEFISTSESSSDDESCIVDVETISPPKMNGDIAQTGAVSKQTHHSPPVIGKSPKSDKKNSSFSSQKSEKKSSSKSSPEKSKLKDKTNLTDSKSSQNVKALNDSSLCALDVVTDTFPMPEPLLSPIPNLEASSIKSLPGITIVNGKPSVMVRIDLSKLERIPAKRESENDMGKKTQCDGADLLPLQSEKIKLEKCEVKTSPAETVQPEKQTSKSTTTPDDITPVPKTEPHSNVGINKPGDTPKSDSAAAVDSDVMRTTDAPSTAADSALSAAGSALPAAPAAASTNVNRVKPALPRIPKRKSVGDGKSESKRIKTESSRKSTPKRKSEVLSDQKEPTSHEDDHEWDRKHPRRSSERRNSTSSNSSRHSSTRSDREINHDSNSRDRWDNNNRDNKWDRENRDSSKDVLDTNHESVQNRDSKPARDSYKNRKEREVSRDKDLPDRDGNKNSRDREKSKDREREKVNDSKDQHDHNRDWDRDLERERNRIRDRDREHRLRDWDAPNGVSGHSDEGSVVGHRAAKQWSSLVSGKELPPHDRVPAHDRLSSLEPPHKVELFPEEKGLKEYNYYHSEAKNLKNQATAVADAVGKAMKYMEAVLSFLLSCHTLERDGQDNHRIFAMYKDTHGFAKSVGSRYFGTNDLSQADDMKKLLSLLLKIQAIVSLKLYHLKRVDVTKLKKAIDDHNSKPPSCKPSAQAPSPYQGGWNKSSTGTPSPMSPQPSPVGSTSSLGSQGSSGEISTSRLTNGTGTSSSTVTIPSRIHSITHNYITYVQYLVQSDDLWDQSDMQAKKYKAFFDKLDCQCGGPLSLHSSILSLVRYVRCGLHKLKDT